MFFFLYVTSNVSFINRLPSQTSHGTYTVGKKCISTAISPFPWQASHRPPFTLKEKRLALYPLTLASSVSAKSSLINVHAPVYVAGFDRGVRPIADWSIKIVLPAYSVPVKLPQL